ncbi:MAG: glutathione S-transferase [Rhodobacteraceae bacterium]|nr:glutathione S-transferase [Paracoccaceae bacterium]
MTYDLAIGDRSYSSWSLRGWLFFSKFGIPVKSHTAKLYTDELPRLLESFKPARLVPAVKYDGVVVHDTLAIAETLNERHPEAQMWPADPGARAMARSITAEMHSGLAALRNDCPMNLLHQWEGFAPSDAVLKDCERVQELWQLARNTYGNDKPWLFGDYSIADAFFAPLASRFATYDLPRNSGAGAYINAHLNDPQFRIWRAMGIAQNHIQPVYDMGLPHLPWPGPAPLPAKPVASGPSENTHCPYSGDPVTDYLELDGRVFGFCNPFCRDKTVADAAAWPAFLAIYQK